MTLSLHVDGPAWREHQRAVLDELPGLVPVIKGNGYGFGRRLLAREAARLGVTAVAVGTAHEIADVVDEFPGDVLVLTPWQPGVDPPPEPHPRVVRTASTLAGLGGLAGHRVVVEALTSMRRFGLSTEELPAARDLLDAVDLEGFALHLPLDEGDLSRVEETEALIATLWGAALPVSRLWLSHLTAAEVGQVHGNHPDLELRNRVGTRLWMGDQSMFAARASVLAVHPLRRGERFGYRQRRAPGPGHLLVVGGGTAHGVGLEAPRLVRGLRGRARAAASSGLEATNRALSPFSVDGRKRWFAEPPHMQVSLVWLPEDVPAPAVGDELDLEVRMTIAAFDRVVVSD